ncbi:4Fe-4S dicluster domain-containing protein [uncultured Eubacterium sp.]|uniref:4Fe-4S dicluster domain-containing protein n=1 Tax=uncultured Eubacterium sp. TaxID=165185 RepID=UPI0025968511|nr:4Fe-4S dicluster domain-containing protein [uncultured Eubacterium sp.]
MSRVICDEKRCSGCLACVAACLDQHYEGSDYDAVPLRSYEMKKREHSDLQTYVTTSCHHCEPAACMEACKFGALTRDARGFVIADRTKCRGCRMCLRVCPYDVPKFDAEGKIVKCDGCSVRVALGMEPACVRACNTGALKYEKSKIDIVF